MSYSNVPGTDSPYGVWLDAAAHTLAFGMRSGVLVQPGRSPGKRPDMAVALADAIARMAANEGGLEFVLDASPADSRLAELVRQLVGHATPASGLLSLRTQPVRMTLDAGAELQELTAKFTAELDEVHRTAQDAATDTGAGDARQLAAAMNQIYQADKETWCAELARAMRESLTARGLPEAVPVEVIDVGADGEPVHDGLTQEIFEEVTGRCAVHPTHLEPFDWSPSTESYSARVRAGESAGGLWLLSGEPGWTVADLRPAGAEGRDLPGGEVR